MNYKIQTTHKVTAQEFSVDWNGFNFLVIYGQHKNGWFIAIPNWNVCVESAEPENDSHNTTVLARAHFHDEAPVYLAKAIREHWEGGGEMTDMELEMQRYAIEEKEKWREIYKKIPPLNFKEEWSVKIIPPFGGALARFLIDYKDNHVSVWLDWYGRFGRADEPHWELYPWEWDVKRYCLTNTEELLKDIQTVLEGNAD